LAALEVTPVAVVVTTRTGHDVLPNLQSNISTIVVLAIAPKRGWLTSITGFAAS